MDEKGSPRRGRRREEKEKPAPPPRRAYRRRMVQCLPNPVSDFISLTDFYTDHLLSVPHEYEFADDAVALQRAEEALQLELGISASDLEALRQDCSVSALLCPREPSVADSMLAMRPPDSLGLETLSRLRRAMQEDEGLATSDGAVCNQRTKRLPVDLSYLNARDQGSTEVVGSSFLKDILLTVQVMKPMRRGPLGASRNTECKIHQQIEVLGRQLLSDLRDRISCHQDYAILGDCSECLDNVPSDVQAKDVYPSNYLFIESVFYPDLRLAAQKDLSAPVREWILASADRRAVWGDVTWRRMDQAHFRELTVRVGEPYLYVHQGDCEHVVVISDLRMVGPHDCQDPLRYPVQTGYRLDSLRMCKACQRSPAKWGVVGSDLLPEDPCFLCETCLRMLLYHPDGRKQSPKFRVFALSRAQPNL